MKIKYLSVLIVLLVIGCKEVLFNDDPQNTPDNNFEMFWGDFDKYYVYFDYNNISWDSIHSVYKAKISPNTTDKELFTIFSEMAGVLKDGHVNIYSPYGMTSYQLRPLASYPSKRLINPLKYIIGGSPQKYSEIIEYREIKEHNIGFIMLKNFAGNSFADNRYTIIDDVLDLYKNKDGIIIDVRGNGGGSSNNAITIASRFADMKRLCSKVCSKNGPGKNDYSGWKDNYIQPEGKFQFTKPVVVLTSRKTFSAAESFVLAMKVLPHVVLVGDTTGGGFGDPIIRELPNGWSYRLSTGMEVDANLINYQGKGIPPNISVQTSFEDSIKGIDRILEKGIEIIAKSK